MAEAIAFVLRNLPVFLFVAALALAAAWRTGASGPDRLLGWILLLPIGVTGLWAAVFHLFFPQIAAADIGWELESVPVRGRHGGSCDWRDRLRRASGAAWTSRRRWCMMNSIFLLGDAVGHVEQMIAAGNFAPGNAGIPFYSDIAFPVLALVLLIIVQRSRGGGADFLKVAKTRSRCAPPRRSARRREPR